MMAQILRTTDCSRMHIKRREKLFIVATEAVCHAMAAAFNSGACRHHAKGTYHPSRIGGAEQRRSQVARLEGGAVATFAPLPSCQHCVSQGAVIPSR